MRPDAETKDQIRSRILELRKQLDTAFVREGSGVIARRVLAMKEFSRAEVVGTYMAMPREAATMDLMYAAWDMGKTVLVPAWDGDSGGYRMARMSRGTEMECGPAGVLQPRAPDWVPTRDADLMIVPVVACDYEGRRLGHGGGHYDRLLRHCRCFRLAMAFEFQVVEKIPFESHDVPVDLVVTEQNVYPEHRTETE